MTGAYMSTGGHVKGRCCVCGEPITSKMGWAHLYSRALNGYLGVCSVEHWDILKACEDQKRREQFVSGYLDDGRFASEYRFDVEAATAAAETSGAAS